MFCSITVHCYMDRWLFSVVAGVFFFISRDLFKVQGDLYYLAVAKHTHACHTVQNVPFCYLYCGCAPFEGEIHSACRMPALRNSLSNQLIKTAAFQCADTHLTVHCLNYCIKLLSFVHYYLCVSVAHPCHNKKSESIWRRSNG